MDLISAITGWTRRRRSRRVQMSVARKVLDVQQFEGEAAVKLIQAASQTTSKAGDALRPAAHRTRGQMDTYA